MKDIKKIALFLVVVVGVLFFMLQDNVTPEDKKEKKPLVALSTFALYDIANAIAKDKLDVFMIMPVGVDAHSFEPTPKLMAKIQQSALVVYSGAGLEPWTHQFAFKNKVLNMSEYVHLQKLDGDSHHEHHEHDEYTHHHGSIDPHYWLDIQNMIIATDVITEELIRITPQYKEFFLKNKITYIQGLKKLQQDFQKTLVGCKQDTIIVNHNAFSYIAHKYGFEVEALSGLSPDAQPSAKTMLELIKHVKEDNISVVFFESFVSDKAIKSIANEAKVRVDVLYPLGNITKKDKEQNLTYKDIMEKNLQKISNALECQ